ncbi:hypothetical protein HDU82_002951 [Entophlyctis luteolus]|nr:hypothetical protein HDU82_002951 [Entophlyctis luteolus]
MRQKGGFRPRRLPIAAAVVIATLLAINSILSEPDFGVLETWDTQDEPSKPIPERLRRVFSVDDGMWSQVYVPIEDAPGYRVCHFENVCVTANATYIFAQNATLGLERRFKKCFTKQQSALSPLDSRFCDCFSKPAPYVFVKQTSPEVFEAFDANLTYMVYNWLPHHHISHFAFSTVNLHSLLQHEAYYSLPKFKKILFQDLPPGGFTEYEQDLWNIITHGNKLQSVENIEFLRDGTSFIWLETDSNLELSHIQQQQQKPPKQQQPGMCFKHLYSSKLSEIYSRSRSDLSTFRKSAEKVLGLDITSEVCPPSRVLIVTRGASLNGTRQRAMLNKWHVLKMLDEKGITQIDEIDLNSNMTLKEQAQTIAKYGLIISSHSSQLTNLLFAHKNAVVMEVGVIYKPAFRNLGVMAGTYYINSVGHKPDKVGYYYRGLYPRLERECNFTLMGMGNLSTCRLSSKEIEAMKNSDYRVRLDFFEKDLDNALAFLESKCVRRAGWKL